MNKLYLIATDVAVTVGCVVGVGFLTGNEAKTFWNNSKSVVAICLTFALCTIALRLFCHKNKLSNTQTLLRKLFGKWQKLAQVVVAVCCFLCIVAVLAGVSQVTKRYLFATKLPVGSATCALLSAWLLQQKTSVVRVANVVALLTLVLSFALIVCVKKSTATLPNIKQSNLFCAVVYALYSLCASVGATTKLSCNLTAKQNVVATLCSSALLCLLMIALLGICCFGVSLPTMEGVKNRGVELLFVASCFCCSVTGICANVLPVLGVIKNFCKSKDIAIFATFTLALALSLVGCDVILTYGYVAIAFVGASIVVAVVVNSAQSCKKTQFINKYETKRLNDA